MRVDNAIEQSHVQLSSQSLFVVPLKEPLTATIVLDSCQGCDRRPSDCWKIVGATLTRSSRSGVSFTMLPHMDIRRKCY